MKTRFFTLLFVLLCRVNVFALTEFTNLSFTLYTNHTAEVVRPKSTGNYVFSTPTKVIIPSTITYNDEIYTVTRIGENAFLYQSNLYEVEIPESVTYIGKSAFYASGLTSLVIPNSVTNIESYAFEYCDSIKSITIGTNLGNIGIWAFEGCENIMTVTWNAINCSSWNFGNQVTSFTFGEEVQKIPSSTCEGMTLLTSITIPNSVTSIGSSAFSGCIGLTSITIPNNVTSIGSSAFSGCIGLTSITIPNSVTSIGSSAFSGCIGLTSITIPNNVTSIGSSAFSGCIGLTSIAIPNSVTSIGSSAFSNCSDLSGELIIPNSVTSIGSNAFANCIGLTSIVIEGRPRLSANSFNGCTNLQGIYCLSDTPPIANAEPSCLSNTNDCPIYYPCGMYENYKYVFTMYLDRLYQNPDCAQTFTVTFQDWNGQVLKIEQVEEGHSATAPANPTREGYTFTGWDKDFSNVQSNLTVTAQYTQNTPSTTYYTVTFKDWDGTVLKNEQVEKGHSATAPANPTREGYTFSGWDKDFSNVQSDLVVTAQYTQNSSVTTSFTVTFQDWDGTVLKNEQVDKGKSATAPTNPTREGYTFTGWDKIFSNVQSDLMITAQYKKNNPSSPFVGFESTDAHSLATQIYSENLIQNITNVTLVETDAAAHKYSINLVNGGEGTFSMGGVVFSYTNEEAGKTAYKTYIQYIQPNGVDREIRIPTVKGQQIRITLAENCAGMLVDGVSKDFVAGDNIITANGSSLVITNPTAKPKITAIKPYAFVGSSEYTVTFKDWNGKILKAEIVAEGMSATAPANPTREGYTFTGWDKDFSNVQSDLIITAQYERVNEAVENVQAENITSRKVMINGQIFILRGEKVYTVTGQEVR